jgi:hypothetical protein
MYPISFPVAIEIGPIRVRVLGVTVRVLFRDNTVCLVVLWRFCGTYCIGLHETHLSIDLQLDNVARNPPIGTIVD